jgi:hypothetical protein
VGISVGADVAVGGTSVGGLSVGVIACETAVGNEGTTVAVGETVVAAGPQALTTVIRVKRMTVLTIGLNIGSLLVWAKEREAVFQSAYSRPKGI